MKFDEYTIISRIFPAIITSVPIYLFTYYFVNFDEIKQLFDYITGIQTIQQISVYSVLLFLFSMLLRYFAKQIEKKMFTKNRGFPTTYFILFSDNTYSINYKKEFRNKVFKTFKISLPDEIEEKTDLDDAIKRTNEIQKQVLGLVRNKGLVKKHNIWYGFYRNVVAGSIIAFFLSVVDIISSFFLKGSTLLLYSAIVVCFIYIIIMIIGRKIIKQSAEDLGSQILTEFMNLK